MGKCIKSFFKWAWEKITNPLFLWFLLIVAVSLLGLYLMNHDLSNLIKESSKGAKNAVPEIDAALYWLTGVATAFLAVIAWYKIGQINKDQEAALLMQLDERWTSKRMLIARTIIHNIYKSKANSTKLSDKEYSRIALEIVDMSDAYYDGSKKKYQSYYPEMEVSEQFMMILNFLDFLETIGFMFKNNDLNIEKLNSINGESILFYFRILKGYVEHKNRKHNKVFYPNFTNLHNILEDLERKRIG